jgi:hypothetical protein
MDVVCFGGLYTATLERVNEGLYRRTAADAAGRALGLQIVMNPLHEIDGVRRAIERRSRLWLPQLPAFASPLRQRSAAAQGDSYARLAAAGGLQQHGAQVGSRDHAASPFFAAPFRRFARCFACLWRWPWASDDHSLDFTKGRRTP